MRRIGLAQRKQGGAVLIMAALAALVLFGFMGIALNLSHACDLKSELQNMADAAALSGAKALNGTLTGINTAVANAKATAASNKYNFSSSLALADANYLDLPVRSEQHQLHPLRPGQICQPGTGLNSACVPVNYSPVVGLFSFLGIPIPESTVVMPAESLGFRPSGTTC